MNFWLRSVGYGVLIVLALWATISSFQFVRPLNCQMLCMEPAQAPCPSGACGFGEQRAGFPLPMVRDAETGSPTGGWGKLGQEDYLYLNLIAFLANVLFYAAVLWLLWQIPLAIGKKSILWRRLRLGIPAVAYIGVMLFAAQRAYQPAPPWQPPTGPPAAMILGTWHGRDATSGEEITFRFYDDQRVLWSRPSDPMGGGEAAYRLMDAQTLRISFVDRRPGVDGMCTHIPSILGEACQSQLFRPTPSAAQEQANMSSVIAASQPTPADPRAVPSPTLPPYDLTVSTLDTLVTMTVDAETLTLRLPTGLAQAFQRVTAP